MRSPHDSARRLIRRFPGGRAARYLARSCGGVRGSARHFTKSPKPKNRQQARQVPWIVSRKIVSKARQNRQKSSAKPVSKARQFLGSSASPSKSSANPKIVSRPNPFFEVVKFLGATVHFPVSGSETFAELLFSRERARRLAEVRALAAFFPVRSSPQGGLETPVRISARPR